MFRLLCVVLTLLIGGLIFVVKKRMALKMITSKISNTIAIYKHDILYSP